MRKLIISIVLVFVSVSVKSQILTNMTPYEGITEENAFLDASENFNTSDNVGKGIVFPQTDLTKFTFITNNLDGIKFPSYFDGMIVYNIAKSGSTADPALKVQTNNLSAGFYYFYNPEPNGEGVANGKWIRIGDASASTSSASKVALTNNTVVETNTTVEGKAVYAVKGTFSFTTAGDNKVNITKPDGFATLYDIKIYRKGATADVKNLVGTSLYSYEDTQDNGETKLKLVFGNGVMSTSYPKGDYEYVIEFLK